MVKFLLRKLGISPRRDELVELLTLASEPHASQSSHSYPAPHSTIERGPAFSTSPRALGILRSAVLPHTVPAKRPLPEGLCPSRCPARPLQTFRFRAIPASIDDWPWPNGDEILTKPER